MITPVDFKSLRTGDIVLFSGKGLISTIIKIFTFSKWSHCGIIIADDDKYDFPLLYESTHDNTLVGLDLGLRHSGVQIVSFEERLNSYNGHVAIRRVINPDYSQRSSLRLYRAKIKGTPFEENKIQMMAAASVFSFLRKGQDLNGIFCSEHVAEAYKALGWMDKVVPSNWFDPRYFATITRLLKNVRLDKVEVIKK